MERWSLGVVGCLCAAVFAGKDTDEELAHYVKKEPSTDMPWTSNERRINQMIEDEINKFNRAPVTTECPFDSQGRPRPTESRHPTWWNEYLQAKYGDRPDWSAEIRDLIKNPRTSPPWTPSQESEPVFSKWKDIEPFTWRPGAPVINLRIKTDATTRPSEPQEPTTERSFYLPSASWDTSEDVEGGGGGKDPPLNLAPLQKGYKGNDDYLKVKPRRTHRGMDTQQHSSDLRLKDGNKLSSSNYNPGLSYSKKVKYTNEDNKEINMKRRKQRTHSKGARHLHQQHIRI